jgi:hypothetical protein
MNAHRTGDLGSSLESFGQTLQEQVSSDLTSATQLGKRQLNGIGEYSPPPLMPQ